MRDMAKSVLSFSLGAVFFGAKQLVNVFQKASTSACGGATGASSPVAGDFFDRTFRAGDTLQRGMVDMMFNSFSPSAFNPAWWMKTSMDTIQRSTGAFRQGASSGAAGQSPSSGGAAGPCSGSTGWGPVS